MALGDFTLELRKPLGMILVERQAGGDGGVYVNKELVQVSTPRTKARTISM
jgi:hypothetical protein